MLRSCGAMWRRGAREQGPQPHSTGVPASRSRSASNDSFMRFHSGPGLPVPTGRSSMRVTGMTSRVAAEIHTSSAARSSSMPMRRIVDRHRAVGELQRDVARRAGQDATAVRRRRDRALRYDEDARRRAFEHVAVAHDDRFLRAGIGGALLHQHVRQQRRALDVAAAPAEILHGDRGHAVRAQLVASAPAAALPSRTRRA